MSKEEEQLEMLEVTNPKLKVVLSLKEMTGTGSLSLLSGEEAESIYALFPELAGHIQTIRQMERHLKLLLSGLAQELQDDSK